MRNYTTEAEPTDLVAPWLEPLLPELIDFRRDLHAHPELSFKEFRTTDKLAERLEAAGLTPRRLEGTGLTVDVGEGPIATALRGDIDALPIIEETGLPFASKNHGVTHACGHDVHTTTMLG
ncbi:MAG: amidohydrolase, partial [Arthrobacter sp.]|nr:amidohydrolase [Arthrobacter sp.]